MGLFSIWFYINLKGINRHMSGYANPVHIRALHWLTEYRDWSQSTGFHPNHTHHAAKNHPPDYSISLQPPCPAVKLPSFSGVYWCRWNSYPLKDKDHGTASASLPLFSYVSHEQQALFVIKRTEYFTSDKRGFCLAQCCKWSHGYDNRYFCIYCRYAKVDLVRITEGSLDINSKML